MTYRLRYRRNTDLADRFPLPTITHWETAEAAEAARMNCINADKIEVVESD